MLFQSERASEPTPPRGQRFQGRPLPELPPLLFVSDPPSPGGQEGGGGIRRSPLVIPPTFPSAVAASFVPVTDCGVGPTAVAVAASVVDPATGRTVSGPAVPSVRLWLVARDPFTLVAYWDPPSGNLRASLATWGAGTWQLRVWREAVGHAPAPEVTLEVPADPAANHRFIPVLHAGHRYVVELGHLSREGAWRSVTHSDPMATPADHGVGGASAPEYRTVSPVGPGPRAGVDAPSGVRGESSRNPSARVRGTRSVVVGQRTRIVEEEFRRQDPGASEQVLRVSRPVTESVLATVPVWPSEVVPAGARGMESLGQPSSGVAVTPPVPRGFWFEVHAELIVHGRTERGAAVTLGGRPVRLRADGSFTFRFALPDGDYSLPAVAVSEAGDDRRVADLRFVRTTRLEGDVGVHPLPPGLLPPVPAAVVNPPGVG